MALRGGKIIFINPFIINDCCLVLKKFKKYERESKTARNFTGIGCLSSKIY